MHGNGCTVIDCIHADTQDEKTIDNLWMKKQLTTIDNLCLRGGVSLREMYCREQKATV